MKIKILKPLFYKRNYKVGEEIEVQTDEDNTPLDKFWRDRLKDAKIDECVLVVDNDITLKNKVPENITLEEINIKKKK